MRVLLLAIAVATTIGCGDDAVTPADLAVAADLSVARDLSMQLSCAGIVGCVSQCASGTGYVACVAACGSAGSTAAQGYYGPVANCTLTKCAATDGGAPPCADPKSGACATCVTSKCGTEVNACLTH